MNHNMEEDNIKDEDEAKGSKTILIKEEVILSDDEEEFGVDIKIETNEDPSLLNKGGCSPSREANIEISVPAVCVTELETREEPNTSDPLCNNIDLSNATNNIKCKPIQTYSSVGAKKHSRYLCSFKGCGRKMAAFSSLHFYNFPVHKPYICQLWVTNSENEVLATLEKNNLSSRVVCEKHFESKCFTSAMKLNPWAVPTVPFLEESITEPKQVGTPNSEMEDGNVAEELNTIYIKEEAIFSDEELDEDVKVEATEDPLQMNEGSCSPSNKDKIETSTPSVQEREQETCEEPNTSNELTTKKFVCKLCERSFSSAFHLKEHAIIHTKPFKCNFCDESFLIRMQLVDHLNKTHAEKKPLNCEFCDRFFSKKADLTRHLKTHYGGKAYKICEICDKKFSKFCNLTRHIRTHPCNCEICDKRFSVRSELIRHLSIHTGEKPFICGVCEKRFSLKLLLIDHLRTHTGERPYKCGFCDKSFSQIGNLDRHIGTHTGSYECEVCNQCFAEKKHLTQHSRIHHGQLAFECGFCKLKYARSNTLIKHIKLAHWRSLDFVKFVT